MTNIFKHFPSVSASLYLSFYSYIKNIRTKYVNKVASSQFFLRTRTTMHFGNLNVLLRNISTRNPTSIRLFVCIFSLNFSAAVLTEYDVRLQFESNFPLPVRALFPLSPPTPTRGSSSVGKGSDAQGT